MDSSPTTLTKIDSLEPAQSSFREIQDFSRQMRNISNSDITICSQNIRSVYSNIDDVCITLSQFNFTPNVIVLTECRLNEDKTIPFINNYTSFHTTYHLNQCDGVVIYVKENLRFRVKEVKLTHASCLLN